MNPNNDTPSIRFAGFTDAWEQRKLGEVAPLRGGYAFQSSHFKCEGIPIVKISNILQNGEVGGDFDYYDEISSDENFTLPDGAAVLAMSGATTGKVSILSNKEKKKIYQNQRVGYFSPCENIAYSFIQTITRSHLFTEQLKSVLVAGAQPNVSSKDIDNFEFYFPTSIFEQSRIGAFLTEIDSLITLHQRKYDQLVNIKKSMLDKMFPKNGELVPEVRFAGFTDAWEQRRLGEYLETSTEKNTENIYGITDVLSVSGDSGVVNQIEFQGRSFAGASVSGYGILRTGEVVYTKSPLKSAPYGIIKTNKGKTGIVSVLYGVYRPKENLKSELVQIYFEQNARLNNYLRPLVNKGAKNTLLISDDDALRGEVIFPKAISEQRKICALFSNLDRLITLHQRKLERLQNIKKACLEKMFV